MSDPVARRIANEIAKGDDPISRARMLMEGAALLLGDRAGAEATAEFLYSLADEYALHVDPKWKGKARA